MTERAHYDPSHLSDNEVEEITVEVRNHWQAVITGRADPHDILYADPDELSDEYAFWAGELKRRRGYVNCTATEDH